MGLPGKLRKFFSLPPQYMLFRVQAELAPYADRMPAGRFDERFSEGVLLKVLEADSVNDLHRRVMAQPVPWSKLPPAPETLERWAQGETARLVRRAETALAGEVDLLGSAPLSLFRTGVAEIDWYRDYKTGVTWPFAYFRDLGSPDPTRGADVKFPWELSRGQWLIPVAQAWRLTSQPQFADYTRNVMEHWIARNPYGWGINWASTMEAAMRVITWCWLYRQMADAPAWQDANFRFRFLRALYLQLVFVRRFIEVSDVNGNHLTADAAALVLGGVFFARGRPRRWMRQGWQILNREIERQVYADGVDFEGSTAYHRLVCELFHLAADAIHADGERVPPGYIQRLLRMADYTEAYLQPDGLAPVIGDNDDARALPLGGQPARDHRYLPAIVRRRWAPEALTDAWTESAAECLWWWGDAPLTAVPKRLPESRIFPEGGVAILRSSVDHVYFCCSPLGLAGRGGHSHNDCLSFAAVLDGHRLIEDPGCPAYTGDPVLRNRFRSTAVHSTPQISDEEINRFISPTVLWFLHLDAHPDVRAWEDSGPSTTVVGSHTGYLRLKPAVTVVRTLTLDKIRHSLTWADALEPDAGQSLRVPLQLSPGVHAEKDGRDRVVLHHGGSAFELLWQAGDGWTLEMEPGAVAPKYGKVFDAVRLVWKRPQGCAGGLRVELHPLSEPERAHSNPPAPVVTESST